ncbi:MAG: T9SS type A sorting domain-containing protein [Cyclobacteriaceae bacterium]
MVVNFNNTTDTWTGTEFQIFGTVNVTAAVTINSSVKVKTGGVLNIDNALSLGTSGGCGFSLAVGQGGLVNVSNTGSDRLLICGVELMKGAGGCNNCGGAPNQGRCAYNGQPYCEPTGGFTGQTAYDQFGYNIALPIKLLDFTANIRAEKIKLDWTTSMEENFSRFIVERSNDGLDFQGIGELPGKGFNIYNIVSKYSFEDDAPLLGFNYYRLKAVDRDESFEYFGVKAIKYSGPKRLAVFPNPSIGDVISFRTNFGPEESDRIILTNQLGVEIFNSQVSTIRNNIFLENKLSSGIYLLRYVSTDLERTVRILVRN